MASYVAKHPGVFRAMLQHINPSKWWMIEDCPLLHGCAFWGKSILMLITFVGTLVLCLSAQAGPLALLKSLGLALTTILGVSFVVTAVFTWVTPARYAIPDAIRVRDFCRALASASQNRAQDE